MDVITISVLVAICFLFFIANKYDSDEKAREIDRLKAELEDSQQPIDGICRALHRKLWGAQSEIVRTLHDLRHEVHNIHEHTEDEESAVSRDHILDMLNDLEIRK